MAKLIVKDGRLCIVGARLVTDSDGAPCVCGGGGPPDCANGIPTLCVRVDFAGIGPMPGFSPGLPEIGLIDSRVETVAGVNRTFQYVDDGTGFVLGTGLIVVYGEYDSTSPFFPERRFTATQLRVEVGLACCGDIIRLVSVSMTAEGTDVGSYIVFQWQVEDGDACQWPVSGDTVPNQTQPEGGLGSYGVGQGGTATVTLTRACADLPDTYALADPCNGGESISVDLEANINALPGVEYQGSRYRLTSESTVAPPLPVTFIPEVCPVDPPTGDFGIATKCDPFFPNAPATVVYAVNPAVGLGNGSVRLIVQYPNPACPERSCTAIVQYAPTTQASSGPATPGTAHLNGTACSLPTQVTCQACPGEPNPNDPIVGPRSTGDDMLDAMGFDPAEELRRIRSGGCCGQPGA